MNASAQKKKKQAIHGTMTIPFVVSSNKIMKMDGTM
jgi:hypothetical protein